MAIAFAALFELPRTHAQSPQETALARSLFEEGVALADKSDWDGAADRFSRAYALKPTAGIAFNYASVLIELGKLVEASELLRRVERDGNASEGLRKDAADKLATVQPRIASLTLHVEGADAEGARVMLGDDEWPKVAWGMASPVDPGTYTVRVLSGDTERARQQFALAPGEKRELTLNLSPAEEAPLAVGPRVAEKPTPTPFDPHRDEAPAAHRPVYKRWWFWTGVGVVVAGGAVAAVLLTRGEDEPAPISGNTNPGVIEW